MAVIVPFCMILLALQSQTSANPLQGVTKQLTEFAVTEYVCYYNFAFVALQLCPHRKKVSYPFDRRLGGPQSTSELVDEEDSSYPYPISNPCVPYIARYSTIFCRLIVDILVCVEG
jgi:hypothetical protein